MFLQTRDDGEVWLGGQVFKDVATNQTDVSDISLSYVYVLLKKNRII